MPLANYDFWSRAAREMPPDGGYGGYESKYKYRIYLVLDEQCSVSDPAGAAALRCLARLEKRLKSDIKVKYPLDGFEVKFRSDVLSALKLTSSEKIYASPIFFVILPKALDDFHPDVHRYAVVDTSPYMSSEGNFNSIGFGQSISKLASLMEESNDLYEDLKASAAKADDDIGWLDTIDVKPRLGWVVFDLKAAVRKLWKRKT